MKMIFRVAVLFAALSAAASAATYKCKDASGRRSYQQQPCPDQSAQTKITSGADDWKMLRARVPIPNSPVGAYLDTYLDVAHIKADGQRRLAVFKQIMRVDGEREAKPTLTHVAYDCAQGRIAVRGSERDLETAYLDPYDSYRKRNNDSVFHNVFADPSVIQKICKE